MFMGLEALLNEFNMCVWKGSLEYATSVEVMVGTEVLLNYEWTFYDKIVYGG